MPVDASFDNWKARLQTGDERAASQVFHRFAQRLIGLARSRLNPVVRQKVDPEDVLQSVFRSFFVRQAGGQLELDSWDSLWSLLTVITLRKCGHRVEHFRAARRDVKREAAGSSSDDSMTGFEAVAREPTPSEAAILTETVEQLMGGLDERERQVLSLRLQGHTVPEISTAVSRTERTVHRALDKIKTRLVHQLRDEDTKKDKR